MAKIYRGTLSGNLGVSYGDLIVADRHEGWADLISPFSSAKGKGTNEPVWKDMGNGQYAYHFDVGDELFTPFHVLHDYKQGTDAYPHIHFLVDAQLNAGEQITWEFHYVIAKGHAQGESLLAPETTVSMTYTATGAEVVGDHIVLECSDADAFDLKEPDTLILGRYTLVSENVTGKVFGIQGDLHYYVDGLTTPNKAPNFYV